MIDQMNSTIKVMIYEKCKTLKSTINVKFTIINYQKWIVRKMTRIPNKKPEKCSIL